MNIREQILDQYNIDIDQVNLLKLYKIDKYSLSDVEFQKIFDNQRKRWTQSVNNGTNERLIKRDQEHLERVYYYEVILRKHLKELSDYYNSGNNETSLCDFARKFFTIVKESNKQIGQREFAFYMMYFREERKNEKAIREMLKKDFKVVVTKTMASDNDEESVIRKTAPSTVIQVRFNKDSLVLLHTCELQYQELQKSDFLKEKYPNLRESFYDFLNLENHDEFSFGPYLEVAAQEAFSRKQNESAEYTPLITYYNTWKDLFGRNDVRDNFHNFKKLVRYPKLTPYFYLADLVDEKFLKVLLEAHQTDYTFKNLNDFLYTYLKPLIDGKHFGFEIDKKLETVLKKIDRHPEDEKHEQKKRSAPHCHRISLPFGLQILRILATWPVYLLQFIFESFRAIVYTAKERVWLMTIPMFVFSFNKLLKTSLYEFFTRVSEVEIVVDANFFWGIFAAILIVGFLPALATVLIHKMAKKIVQYMDLEGYHRTFEKIQNTIKGKIAKAYAHERREPKLYLKMAWPIAVNILIAVIIIAVLMLFFNYFGGSTMTV